MTEYSKTFDCSVILNMFSFNIKLHVYVIRVKVTKTSPIRNPLLKLHGVC